MSTALVTRKAASEMRRIANWCEAMTNPELRRQMVEQAKRDLERPEAQEALATVRRQEAMLESLLKAQHKGDIAPKWKVQRAGWTEEMIDYWNNNVAEQAWQKILDEVSPSYETLESGVKFRDRRSREK